MDSFLKPAIDEIKVLANEVSFQKFISLCYNLQFIEQGFQFEHGGVSKDFKVSLVFFLGDTPASCLIGGFKEGVGGANRCCRSCMIKRTELGTKVKQMNLYMYLLYTI